VPLPSFRKRRGSIGVVCLVVLLALGFFHERLFAALGSYLEKTDPPSPADVIFVLAGDSNGNRILKAAELVRQGYAPQVMVSGPGENYGLYECDLAIPFAVKAGYPESYFLHFEHHAHSTQEEVGFAIQEFHKNGYKKILVVTSDYHTRRSGRVFRGAAPDLQFVVVAAPDKYFSPGNWWHNREGRKTFLVEWEKTVAYWFGI
jgi:uncharacterized SAM-binding protein YcdF (DUF218 family)